MNRVQSFCAGWVSADILALDLRGEQEVRQGENHYLASFAQVGQVASLGLLALDLANYWPNPAFGVAASFSATVLPFALIPFALFAAAIVHDQNQEFIAKFPLCLQPLFPKTIGVRQKKAVKWVVQHFSKATVGAFCVGTVAMAVFGNYFFVVGVLPIAIYHIADAKGHIPHKVSLFVEKYFPLLTLVQVMITGPLFLQVLVVITASQTLNLEMMKISDLVVRSFFSLRGPSIREIVRPVPEKRDLSYREIQEILQSPSEEFVVNPAHAARSPLEGVGLVENRDFSRLYSLFRPIEWESKYALLFNKLKREDRFIRYVKEQFQEEELEDRAVRAEIESYLHRLAEQKGTSKEKFVAEWVKEQMENLVGILQENRPVVGSRRDLEEAMQSISYIIPYLEECESSVEREDILLKLAVEGGDYCAAGIRRTSSEILDGICSKNPSYEFQVSSALLQLRQRIRDQAYHSWAEKYHLPTAYVQDTHVFDQFSRELAYGFYPLPSKSKADFSIIEYPYWLGWGTRREGMFKEYRDSLSEAVAAVGLLQLTTYMRAAILQNLALYTREKEELLVRVCESNEAMERLFFVMNGILKRK